MAGLGLEPGIAGPSTRCREADLEEVLLSVGCHEADLGEILASAGRRATESIATRVLATTSAGR